MKQLTRGEAVAFYETEQWKAMTDLEIARFQLQQNRLCMPINVFKAALSAALGRPVYTHELASDELREEVLDL